MSSRGSFALPVPSFVVPSFVVPSFAVAVVVSLLAAPSFAADFTKKTRTIVATMKAVKKSPARGKLNKADKAANDRAFATLDSLFDFDGFATDCLGKSAAKLDKRQQARFKEQMKGILRYNGYTRGGDAFRQAKITFGKARVRGKKTRVPLTLFFAKEDLTMEAAFVWGASGKVVDLVMDGDSLTSDTRNQVARMLKKKTGAELIKKLDKKLAAAKKIVQ